MNIEPTVVDSAYRWAVVLLIMAAFTVVLLPWSYQKGFPKRSLLQQILGAGSLVVIGAAMANVFGESSIDALLLRARFGFMVPDTGIHGYGWFLVFGYAIGLANLAVLFVGHIMTMLGRLPPWAGNGNDQNGNKEN